MTDFLKKNFIFKEGIASFDIEDKSTKKVIDFYKESPFPNYKDTDNKSTILTKGNKNLLAAQFKNLLVIEKMS